MTTESTEPQTTEASEPIWCANCGNQIYQNGEKWFHLSTGGMSCNIAAKAMPRVSASVAPVGGQPHRCPHYQPKGEDSGGAYNAQIIIDVENDLLDTYSKERINAKPRSWYSLLIKNLIQRIANLRVMLAAPASTVAPAMSPFGYERAITIDWDKHNARRHELIEAKQSRLLFEPELAELAELQWLAGVKRELANGPIAYSDKADRPFYVGSSRHPHFTAADHERMKETLDALSDYPTEEEAEAALQACGTSGKEVVNEFIERLLKENSELRTKQSATPPSTGAEVTDLFPKTTYKDKRRLADKERFKLNAALNDYLFNNCDHEHDGYPNHLACRWCALEIIAIILKRCFSTEGEE